MRGLILSVLLCGISHMALADGNLPWLNQNASSPSQALPQTGGLLPWQDKAEKNVPAPINTTPPAMMQQPAMEDPQLRQIDDRKLNSLASDYYAISTQSKTAVSKLTALQKHVTDFEKAVKGRAYDASDILGDIKKLKGRIAAAKKKAQAEQAPKNTADEVAAKAMETVKQMEKQGTTAK